MRRIDRSTRSFRRSLISDFSPQSSQRSQRNSALCLDYRLFEDRGPVANEANRQTVIARGGKYWCERSVLRMAIRFNCDGLIAARLKRALIRGLESVEARNLLVHDVRLTVSVHFDHEIVFRALN